jgi:hypothetical protein
VAKQTVHVIVINCLSHEKPPGQHGGNNQVGSHSAKSHTHQSSDKIAGNRPYIYCVTRDGRLLTFKLEANTAISVGEFAKFTKGLQVWVPIQCYSCNLIQFVDLGVAFSDEIASNAHSFDSGRTRHYGGKLECTSCKQVIRLQILFSFYASSAMFSLEEIDNGTIVYVIGIREFFKSAKESSSQSGHTTQQGSLMHFG